MPGGPMTGNELLERVRPVEHQLDNGLKLLVRVERASPVVAVVTHVRAGYFDEPDELVGISHVLEHMYFKGTARRGAGDMARETKAAGGYLNAGTIYDRTSYYTVLPSASLDLALDIQADALIHSRIDEEELAKELAVIIEEVKRKLDNPSALATEKLFETLFDVHPMRRWRMGTAESLARLTRAEVMGFYRDMYRAGNILLVVSGDVDPDRVIERVESLYSDVPAGVPDRRARSEPEREGPRLREMSGDIGHTYAEMGWRAPDALHVHTPALDALGMVLGQGRSSRLYRGVRERGLASSVAAYNYTPTEIGVFGVGIECAPASTAQALGAAWAEIARVRARDVAVEELERVRTLLRARLLQRLETAEGQANLLAEWEALGGWRAAGEYLDRIDALQPADLTAAAARYLAPGRVALHVYRPAGTPALDWDDGELVAALDAHPPATPLPGLPPRTEAVPTAGSAPLILRRASREDGVVQYPLGPGRLVMKRRAHAPLVSLALFRPGGVVREDPTNAGISGLLMRTSLKGTATRSAEAIALESEQMGGSIGVAAGPDLLSWSLTVPSDHMVEALDLLGDVALRPVFPDDAVAKEKAMMLADLDRLRDDMYRYPLRLLLKAAFGDHPYGNSPVDLERALPTVGAEALRRWHADQLESPWIFVVGDADPDRVIDAIETRLGASLDGAGGAAAGTDAGARGVARRAAPEWPRDGRIQEVQRDRAQTALALGFPGPHRAHPDRVTLEVLSAAVSGLGNRLFEELRSRRSLAYTVAAYPMTRRDAGTFVGYIATSADRAAEARSGLLHELGRIRDEPPSEEELERARRYTIGAWQIRTQANAAQLSDLAAALMIGDGLDEITAFEQRINAVARDDVQAAARHWFDEGRLVEGVVRGSASRDAD
jgi:zinc protease